MRLHLAYALLFAASLGVAGCSSGSRGRAGAPSGSTASGAVTGATTATTASGAVTGSTTSASTTGAPSNTTPPPGAPANEADQWPNHPEWIWVDDFEGTDPIAARYHEFDDDGGEFIQTTVDSANGQSCLRARWQAGEVDAGHFMRNFGRNPIGTQSHQAQDFREIYWRYFLKLEAGFVGQPDKNCRATVFAASNWSQAMIAHLWAGNPRSFLGMDPATGIDANGNLASTKWNDFNNLKWLGFKGGGTPLDPGRWYMLEGHVKLNTPGASDGVFEFWLDGVLQASATDLNWVGTWTDYGINSLFISNYWNNGSTQEQDRFIDALVISTQRVGPVR
jgi:hypothetical protein